MRQVYSVGIYCMILPYTSEVVNLLRYLASLVNENLFLYKLCSEVASRSNTNII